MGFFYFHLIFGKCFTSSELFCHFLLFLLLSNGYPSFWGVTSSPEQCLLKTAASRLHSFQLLMFTVNSQVFWTDHGPVFSFSRVKMKTTTSGLEPYFVVCVLSLMLHSLFFCFCLACPSTFMWAPETILLSSDFYLSTCR